MPPMGPPHGRHGMGEKPADFKGTLKKMIRYLGAYKWLLLAIVLFALGSTAFSVMGPTVLAQATTELFNGAVAKVQGTGSIDFSFIAATLALTMGIYCASALCSFLQSWIMATATQRLCFTLRQQLAEKINRVPFGYFEQTSVGDTLSRITNDVDTLGQSLNQALTQLVTSAFTVVGIIVMMLLLNPLMTLLVLLLVPFTVGFAIVIVRLSQPHFFTQQNTLGVINGIVEESFSGHTVLVAFNGQKHARETFDEANDRLYNAARKANFTSSFMKPCMDLVGNIGYAVIAIVGSLLAYRGSITVGAIQAFIQYEKNFMQPISSLGQIANMFQQMAAAAERIFAFLEQPEVAIDDERAREQAQALVAQPAYDSHLAEEVPAVEFSHVTFGYDAEKPVIADFSARVMPCQTVAFVGPTGAGKTTLVKLLMRFYDVQGGAIYLNGQDIRFSSRADIRSNFAMVLQDTWLFEGSVAENLRYGNLAASDEEMYEAAKAVGVHHFIQTLPGGYDYRINEEGDNISAGQRQLLTIARALLANRSMLILDEATSSVDTRTEAHIQQAMDTLMNGRTSFIIAHRLSTIRNANLIIALDKGGIREAGTHEELLAAGGFYASLYNAQFEE